ncbi:unnamed protein product [Musa acuminata subsp. burmannicoides]
MTKEERRFGRKRGERKFTRVIPSPNPPIHKSLSIGRLEVFVLHHRTTPTASALLPIRSTAWLLPLRISSPHRARQLLSPTSELRDGNQLGELVLDREAEQDVRESPRGVRQGHARPLAQRGARRRRQVSGRSEAALRAAGGGHYPHREGPDASSQLPLLRPQGMKRRLDQKCRNGQQSTLDDQLQETDTYIYVMKYQTSLL